MLDISIPWPPDAPADTVERAIERAIEHAGLVVTMRGTLKKYPGCMHWHVKQARLAGTLEITLWPDARRAWFTVQSGRRADWIANKMSQVASSMSEQLAETHD